MFADEKVLGMKWGSVCGEREGHGGENHVAKNIPGSGSWILGIAKCESVAVGWGGKEG